MLLAVLLLCAPTELPDATVRAVGEPEPAGLWLSATAEGAWLDDDLWLGSSPGVGVELDVFALHVRAPLYLSVFDAAPARDEQVPACAFVRCRPFLNEAGHFDPTTLSQLIEHVRIGRAGDWLYASGGPVFATLGEGRVVDRYLSSPRFDRQSGLYARAHVEPLGLAAEAVVGNLFAPQQMSAARVELRPLRALTDPSTLVGGFLSRARVATEAGVDVTAGPRPLLAVATSFAWPLLEEGGWLGLSPWVASSLLAGVEPETGVGVGASAGVRLEVRAPFVGARLDVEGRADGRGHRAGVFSTVYELERTRALAGSPKGIARVPLPGGTGYALGGELVLGDLLRVGGRMVDDTAVGADTVEVYSQLSVLGLAVGARALRRGVTSVDDVLVLDERTLVIAEGSLRFWGPFSAFARWYRTPHVVDGALAPSDEVIVGLSGDLVLAPGLDDDG